MNESLGQAFQRTEYWIDLADGWTIQRVGLPVSASLARWLNAAGRDAAWLITACNPGATRCAPSSNDARQQSLELWACDRGYRCRGGINRDPRGQWPDERSLLITGIGEDMARMLANRFGQLALILLPVGAAVELVWSSPYLQPAAES